MVQVLEAVLVTRFCGKISEIPGISLLKPIRGEMIAKNERKKTPHPHE
jgi:hypothetical protein